MTTGNGRTFLPRQPISETASGRSRRFLPTCTIVASRSQAARRRRRRREAGRTPQGTRTGAGLRHNIRVGIQYLEAWLGGQGAVPIDNLMEDAATAEISRTQIWQWLKHRAALEDGSTVTRELVARRVDEEYARVREEVGARRFDRGHFPAARRLFEQVATSEDLEEFLTIPAYDVLTKIKN